MASIAEWRAASVRAIRDLTPDIRLIEIAPEEGFVAPASGAHLKVGVTIGGRPDTRSYSLVGPCADRIYRIAVKRLWDTRGGSAFMWGLAPGARLMISGPENNFTLGSAVRATS